MTGERERTITFFTGAVATELLIGIDEPSMRLAYTVTDGPLKAAHYNAAVQVIAVQTGSCRFVWAVDVLPAGRTAELDRARRRRLAAPRRPGTPSRA